MKIILKRNKSELKYCCPSCDLYRTYGYIGKGRKNCGYRGKGRKICGNCKDYEYYTIVNKQDIEPTFVIQEEE